MLPFSAMFSEIVVFSHFSMVDTLTNQEPFIILILITPDISNIMQLGKNFALYSISLYVFCISNYLPNISATYQQLSVHTKQNLIMQQQNSDKRDCKTHPQTTLMSTALTSVVVLKPSVFVFLLFVTLLIWTFVIIF